MKTSESYNCIDLCFIEQSLSTYAVFAVPLVDGSNENSGLP